MRPMDGFPDSFGSHRASVFPHAGPASYTQVVEGVAPANATGGDEVSATEAGMKYFDFIASGLTDSGKYRVEVIPQGRSGYVANPSQIGSPAAQFTLRWVVVATGAEVAALVDLSAEIVRLSAIGPK